MRQKIDGKPYKIFECGLKKYGKIGIGICPGHSARKDIGIRDLKSDLMVIKEWNASVVLTLLTDEEFDLLGVPNLGAEVQGLMMDWVRLPIRDESVPESSEYPLVSKILAMLLDRVRLNENVFIHCRGGLGRSGLIACQILKGLGVSAPDAMSIVRFSRPGAVENNQQENFVLNFVQTP
ncbi:dual specificity protein phosphatase family protein [Alphaproteobacteria bacterium]|nr:dual specificity protein phosphatase family protein [Alphaproteobacteria bacterium]